MLARSYVLPFYRTPGRAKAARAVILKARAHAAGREQARRSNAVMLALRGLPYDVAKTYLARLDDWGRNDFPMVLAQNSLRFLEIEVLGLAAVHEALASAGRNVTNGHSPDRRAPQEPARS